MKYGERNFADETNNYIDCEKKSLIPSGRRDRRHRSSSNRSPFKRNAPWTYP